MDLVLFSWIDLEHTEIKQRTLNNWDLLTKVHARSV